MLPFPQYLKVADFMGFPKTYISAITDVISFPKIHDVLTLPSTLTVADFTGFPKINILAIADIMSFPKYIMYISVTWQLGMG